jgi:hypothetical protein
MLIQLKSDFRFERQACAFEDDFWSEFIAHAFSTKFAVYLTNSKTFQMFGKPKY